MFIKLLLILSISQISQCFFGDDFSKNENILFKISIPPTNDANPDFVSKIAFSTKKYPVLIQTFNKKAKEKEWRPKYIGIIIHLALNPDGYFQAFWLSSANFPVTVINQAINYFILIFENSGQIDDPEYLNQYDIKLYLAIYDSKLYIHKFYYFCGLCLDEKLRSISPDLHSMADANFMLNSNGNLNKINVNTRWYPKILHISGNGPKRLDFYKTTLEALYLQYILLKWNFTFGNFLFPGSSLRIYPPFIVFEGSLIRNLNILHLTERTQIDSHIYCTNTGQIEAFNFSSLTQPFSYHTWILLLGAILGIWGILRIKYFFKIFSILIRQGEFVRFEILFAIWTFTSLYLTILYESFVTGSLTVPREEWRFQDLGELLNSGYKIIIFKGLSTEASINYMRELGFKGNDSELEKYFSRYDSYIISDTGVNLLNILLTDPDKKLIFPFRSDIIEDELNILNTLYCGGEMDKKCKCFSTKNKNEIIRFGIVLFHGHFSARFRKTYQNLIEFGFGEFKEKCWLFPTKLEIAKRQSHEKNWNEISFKELNLDDQISVCFIFYLSLVLFCLIAFIVEMYFERVLKGYFGFVLKIQEFLNNIK